MRVMGQNLCVIMIRVFCYRVSKIVASKIMDGSSNDDDDNDINKNKTKKKNEFSGPVCM